MLTLLDKLDQLNVADSRYEYSWAKENISRKKISCYTNCNVWNCNTEAWLKIMEWYFCGDSKKPLCKAIWLVCHRHAKMLSDEGIVSRIQVLH